MASFYIDTNIWLDFLLERKDRNKDLGNIALKFFYKILRNEDNIIVSNTLFHELDKNISLENIRSILLPFNKILIKTEETEEMLAQANKISKERNVSRADVIYALLAKNNNAIIISRDKHFKELSDICISKRPEELVKSPFAFF